MPVTINGNGSISGLSVGGLPNGTVDADTLATNSVTSTKIATGAVGSVGKILQVVSTNVTATSSVSFGYDGARDPTPASVTITSSAANSKFLVSGSISGEGTREDYQIAFVLRRIIGGSATDINVGDASGSRVRLTAMNAQGYTTSNQATTPSTSVIAPYLDSPSQSSGTDITYRIDITGAGGGGTFYFGRTKNNDNNGSNELLPNYITVMEIAA